MKAVRPIEDGVEVIDVDEPPGAGELLHVKSASICSSDFTYIGMGTPKILGHEGAGLRADGTPVVVEALYGRSEREECLRGRYNLCPTHGERALGFSADGGMAEQFRSPAARLVPLPAGLDVRDASIIEPAAVSWHAVRLAGVGPGSRVAVVGGGALGLLAVAAARRQGAEEVALDARHPHQVAAGQRLGATPTLHGYYDVVVESAGSPAGLARSIELVATRGIVVVVGVFLGTSLEIDWNTLFFREATLIPSLGYSCDGGEREIEQAAAMLAAQPEIARTLITHRFPIEDAAESFRVARDKKSGAIRVVVEP